MVHTIILNNNLLITIYTITTLAKKEKLKVKIYNTCIRNSNEINVDTKRNNNNTLNIK